MNAKEYLEICSRSYTGTKVTKNEWDMDYLIDEVRELVEEYSFSWDKEVLIPQDDRL